MNDGVQSVLVSVVCAVLLCASCGSEDDGSAQGGSAAGAAAGGAAGTGGVAEGGRGAAGGSVTTGGAGVGGGGGSAWVVDPLPEVSCTHYVDGALGADGNDGSSTASPWASIQHAADSLSAGETVCILAGAYSEHVQVTRSGEPGAFITFAARPGDDVLLDGTGLDVGTGGLFEITDASHVRVTGLRIEHSSWAAILARRADGVLVDQNSTYETLSSGIGVWSSDGARVEANEVRRARYTDGGAQEWISMGSGTNFVIRGNRIHDGLGESYPYVLGIDAKHSHGGLIEGNIIYDVRGSAIYIDGWDTHTYDIVVRGNFVHHASRGISLGSERGALVDDIDIYNNVIVRSSNSGIQISPVADDGPRERIRIFNNTVFESTEHGGGGIYVQSTNVDEIVIRNNIVAFGPNWQGMLRATSPAGITADHNLVFGESKFPEEELGGSTLADPLFADPAIDSVEGFHVGAASPAVDSGSADGAPGFDFLGVSRPLDGDGDGTPVVDIGAFERVN